MIKHWCVISNCKTDIKYKGNRKTLRLLLIKAGMKNLNYKSQGDLFIYILYNILCHSDRLLKNLLQNSQRFYQSELQTQVHSVFSKCYHNVIRVQQELFTHYKLPCQLWYQYWGYTFLTTTKSNNIRPISNDHSVSKCSEAVIYMNINGLSDLFRSPVTSGF